jgi:large subunit ribosomal protein L17
MNSKKGLNKVGGKSSHRKSLQRNLLSDLIIYEYLTTTIAKSKIITPAFEKLITFIKSGQTNKEKTRILLKTLKNESAVLKLIEVYQKRFEKESGGYVNVYKLGFRKGDSAQLVKLMLKGYVYKDIGKKVSEKKVSKKEEIKDTEKKGDFLAKESSKGVSEKTQYQGGPSAQVVKTRSGI